MRLAIAVVCLPVVASAGRVIATRSHWAGDVIVTDSDVRLADGRVITATQLGGSTGGIGMIFSHLDVPVRVGESVTVGGDRIMRDAAPTDGDAAYGLQRTTFSKRALRRANRDIHFVYDAAGTSHIPGMVELGALDDAFATWQLGTSNCGGFRFDRTLETGVANALDGIETIHFRDDTWCRPATETTGELCYPPGVAAVTRVAFVDNPADPDDGTIIEADMDINSVDFALQVDGVTTDYAAPQLDLLGVATHEIGHVLGVAHDCASDDAPVPTDADGAPVPRCDAADADHIAATMYVSVDPGDTTKRTLKPSDIAAGCAAIGDVSIEPDLSGGCSTTHNTSLVWLLAVVPIATRRRRTTQQRVATRPMIAGKYEVLDCIGTGGMATVHRARQRGAAGFDRIVAIKQISQHFASSSEFVARFIHEARIASACSHRSIIQVHDFGKTDEGYFIAMEYVAGSSLLDLARHAVASRIPIPIDVVIAIAIDLCDALDHLHTRVDRDGRQLDLVHRDISLSNVLVTPDGHLKLIDFGIATGRGFELATTGFVGKPSYAAPEMLHTQAVDARADLYAVAVVAWELLAGAALFSGPNTAATLANISTRVVVPPVTRRADCPPRLNAIIMAALSRDPAHRPPSAAAMRDEIAKCRCNLASRPIARWLAAMSRRPQPKPVVDAVTQVPNAADADRCDMTCAFPRFDHAELTSTRSRLRIAALVAIVLCMLPALSLLTWLTARAT